jgi:hypothetical protein
VLLLHVNIFRVQVTTLKRCDLSTTKCNVYLNTLITTIINCFNNEHFILQFALLLLHCCHRQRFSFYFLRNARLYSSTCRLYSSTLTELNSELWSSYLLHIIFLERAGTDLSIFPSVQPLQGRATPSFVKKENPLFTVDC